jgi:hypothetical protein
MRYTAPALLVGSAAPRARRHHTAINALTDHQQACNTATELICGWAHSCNSMHGMKHLYGNARCVAVAKVWELYRVLKSLREHRACTGGHVYALLQLGCTKPSDAAQQQRLTRCPAGADGHPGLQAVFRASCSVCCAACQHNILHAG